MEVGRHMKKKNLFLFALLLLIVLCGLTGVLGVRFFRAASERKMRETIESAPRPESFLDGIIEEKCKREPVTELSKKIYGAAAAASSFRLCGEFVISGQTATQPLEATGLDMELLKARIVEGMNPVLARMVEAATLSTEIYDEELSYRPEILQSVFRNVLDEALQDPGVYTAAETVTLDFVYSEGGWQLSNADALDALLSRLFPENPDEVSLALYNSVAESVTYVRKKYAIEEGAVQGSVPDPSGYGSTADPAVVEALLQSAYARQLIGEQQTVWNAGLELVPDTEIQYYLDETILTLVWQEDRDGMICTFSEVFLGDGSQLRRVLAKDKYLGRPFEYASGFAERTNAVLAFGGDMYFHLRNCGVVVYDREIYRIENAKTDTCFITADGDMLFGYAGEFADEAQARAFVEENDVVFSLAFGPVLIDNGVDVTPKKYAWGEINDPFARSVLGLMGDLHYLTINVNNYYAGDFSVCVLQKATDIALEKGCVKAYTMDGGQTAVTVFHGRVVNPVQFNREREICDMIYFASAVPEPEA